jgi:carbonic anhydrase/acetyltransferase-like protein (isoleucine patch superfamily)
MIREFEGRMPEIGDECFIADSADIIGAVTIGEHSSVWPQCVLRGDVNDIRIGARSNIQDGSVLHVSHAGEFNPQGAPLIIGDRVTVGHQVLLHACRIGNECLIGMGSIVMDDCIVEDRVMIGAGSLLPPGKRLESGYLYLGNPCRRLRALSDRELDYLSYSAEHYVRLKDRHLISAIQHQQ